MTLWQNMAKCPPHQVTVQTLSSSTYHLSPRSRVVAAATGKKTMSESDASPRVRSSIPPSSPFGSRETPSRGLEWYHSTCTARRRFGGQKRCSYRLSPPRPFLHHGKAPGHREILWLFGTQWSVVDPPEASDAFYFPPPFPH